MVPVKILDLCFSAKNRYNNRKLDIIDGSGAICYDLTGVNCSYNFSSIITKLIQEAGRFCLRYASDLFIDLQEICKTIEDGTIVDSSYLFGFRESGVDGDNYIINNLYKNNYSPYLYRSIWRLDIKIEKDITIDEYSTCNYKNFTGTLYEVEYNKPDLIEKEEIYEVFNKINNNNI